MWMCYSVSWSASASSELCLIPASFTMQSGSFPPMHWAWSVLSSMWSNTFLAALHPWSVRTVISVLSRSEHRRRRNQTIRGFHNGGRRYYDIMLHAQSMGIQKAQIKTGFDWRPAKHLTCLSNKQMVCCHMVDFGSGTWLSGQPE